MDAAPSTKPCSKCNEEKPLDEFFRGELSKNGRRKICKTCDSIRNKEWNKNNSEKVSAVKKAWQKNNSEKVKGIRAEYQASEPGKIKASRKKYRQTHPERVVASNATRRASQLNRTPPWADKKAILEIYKQARALQEATGEPYHVDHIYPLQGETVSGLHVESNLRAVPATVNLSKSNSFDPDQCGV